MSGSSQSPADDALKGGFDVGSRVRIAAAACLMASGLLAGGASASIAFADSPLTGEDSVGKHPSDEKPKPSPDEKTNSPGGGGKEEQPGTDPVDPKAEGDKLEGEDGKKDGDDNGNGVGGNPNNGNCGNSGSNGNAQGCGGGGGGADPTTPPTKPTSPPTKTEEPPPPPEEPGECDDKNRDDCSPGWPWWPWPWPWNPGEPPGPGGGGGGGNPEVPSGRPGLPPPMQLPPELMPPTETGPTVVDVEPGVGIAAAQLPIAPITLPVIVAPATGLGGGGGSPGAPALPVAPRV